MENEWFMNTLTKKQYLENPCSTSSIPYWKAVCISIPDNMKILHDREFNPELLKQYVAEPYFRLLHSMREVKPVSLPEGYSLYKASLPEFVEHMNGCYEDIGITVSELQSYLTREQYSSELWLAVRDNHNGKIAATGIAELDREIGEGVLEWIQVSKAYRRRGLGSYLVLELLWRMRKAARFVTVSGKCKNPDDPEGLYRKCGFCGDDVWHVLREREPDVFSGERDFQ